MKASEIKVGNVYYVNFEPHKRGEFDKTHLALVLKKTVNEVTFIVIPMTSEPDGSTGCKKNKVYLDVTDYLPPHLRKNPSYAVYDQVRTVNASRFQKLYEDRKEYDAKVPESIVNQVIEEIIRNLLFDFSDERKDIILNALRTVDSSS